MKKVIQLEESGMLLLSIYLFSLLPYLWWWYLVLILAPDLSMLGYLFDKKIGAIIYNIFHHKGIAIAVYVAGCYVHDNLLQLIGVILLGHSGLDRLLGYGLKTYRGFKFTHLGEIGK